jgi:hypothetical protein
MINNQLATSQITVKKITGQSLGSIIKGLGASTNPYFGRFYDRLIPRDLGTNSETTVPYSIGTILNPGIPPTGFSKIIKENDLEGACFVSLVWLMNHLVLEKNKSLWNELTPIIATGSRIKGEMDRMIHPVLVYRS